MTSSARRRVVIVGGGVAAVSTASALRLGGFDGEVTIVDAGDFPYDRPPLSKDYLAGTTDLKEIALQPGEWYDANAVVLRTLTTVTALRPSEGGVQLADGTVLRADRVVLATGGSAARPPLPGADSPRVHTLRTSVDADRLRERLTPGARVLIVGAGLIGAEIASTACVLGCEVVLLDPLPLPIAAAVGVDVAGWLCDLHRVRGVTTVIGSVESFTDSGSAISAVVAGQDTPRTFDAVVLGVGMVPDAALARAAGLEVERSVIVDSTNVTSNPSVLAVGDASRVRHDGVLLPAAEHWEAAQNDGKRAAATILGAPAPRDTASWFWTDRHHRHVEAVGRMADAARTVVRGTFGGPSFTVFGCRDGYVVGAVGVDDANAVRAARRMIDRRLPVDADDLADATTNLRTLLRAKGSAA